MGSFVALLAPIPGRLPARMAGGFVRRVFVQPLVHWLQVLRLLRLLFLVASIAYNAFVVTRLADHDPEHVREPSSMAAIRSPARSFLRPPTEAESQLALEATRRIGPVLADLTGSNEKNETPRSVEISVHVPGKPAGEPLAIPAEALRFLGSLLDEMAQGHIVTLTPIHAELTTKQAADLLSVSRPFLCKLLDRGDIPHRKVGRHRRVKYMDLMEYKKNIDEARSRDLDELVEQAQQLGMGY